MNHSRRHSSPRWPAALKLTPAQERHLRAESIQPLDKPIDQMTVAELHQHFAMKTTGRINLSLLMKNLFWQLYTAITTKQRKPFKGNIRSLWYAEVKPVLSRVDALSDGDAGYELMTYVLCCLVTDGLLRYRAFGLFDERQEDRRIGKTHGHVLLVSEKRGHWPWLVEMQRKFGVTIMALGGQPSLLSSEYLVEELTKAKPRIDLRKMLPLITVVDYDPAGDVIATSFMHQLKCFGVSKLKRIDLVTPKAIPKAQVEMSQYRLSKSKHEQKRVVEWIKKTGGIDGKPYGLEADAITAEQLEMILKENLERLGIGY